MNISEDADTAQLTSQDSSVENGKEIMGETTAAEEVPGSLLRADFDRCLTVAASHRSVSL